MHQYTVDSIVKRFCLKIPKAHRIEDNDNVITNPKSTQKTVPFIFHTYQINHEGSEDRTGF
jgi:hypothetical protein